MSEQAERFYSEWYANEHAEQEEQPKSELNPCPFCGGEAKLYSIGTGSPHYGHYHQVICQGCLTATGAYWSGEQSAIDAWNTRVGYFCQFSRPTHDEACVLVGELKKAKLNGVNLVPELTCHIVKTSSDSDYVDDWRYRCSECGCNIPVNERDPKTGDVIDAANYCPNCGAKVVDE